jgi:siroheme synthase-like protein
MTDESPGADETATVAVPINSFPVFLDVAGRRCLVVGGGPIAARKAGSLVDCDAAVTVVAPAVGEDMEHLASRLDALERRPYRRGEAAGYRLVIAATGIPDVDGAVFDDGEEAGVWVNSADDRAHSSFILPAVHRDGAVSVAVSTGGLSPALASWLRTRFAADYGSGLGALAQLLGDARARLLRAGRRSDDVDWLSLLGGPLLDLVRGGDMDGARATVDSVTRPHQT